MASEPPPFQEAAVCDVCRCSFNTFRRRHHCRCCGRTLCYEHSSNQMALPQFGIYTNVRVCTDCFDSSNRSAQTGPQASTDGVNTITHDVSRLDIGVDSKAEPAYQPKSNAVVVECKCGMPLCICEAPASTTDASPLQAKPPSTVTLQSNPKPKKTEAVPKHRASTSSNKPSSVFNYGQVNNGAVDRPQMDYEASGEGLREAIKNGDTSAVKMLLGEGVDANYHDKQGLSLLHLAAVFNQTDIAFSLMEFGASMEYKNAQGETPLDCAPATLQYKMKKKLEESSQVQHTSI